VATTREPSTALGWYSASNVRSLSDLSATDPVAAEVAVLAQRFSELRSDVYVALHKPQPTDYRNRIPGLTYKYAIEVPPGQESYLADLRNALPERLGYSIAAWERGKEPRRIYPITPTEFGDRVLSDAPAGTAYTADRELGQSSQHVTEG